MFVPFTNKQTERKHYRLSEKTTTIHLLNRITTKYGKKTYTHTYFVDAKCNNTNKTKCSFLNSVVVSG